MNNIPDGVYPTMITPFNGDLTIDYKGLKKLIDWYAENGVAGLFAVAQSGAMFELSLQERVDLARRVREYAPKHIPVVASGHISDTLEAQVEELTAIADTGIDTLVLLTNRFAAPYEGDDIWKKNMSRLLEKLPDGVPLGLYECPTPYKRVLSDNLISWIVETGRFGFVKDTCCDPEMIKRRGTLTAGSSVKLFNANAPTLLMSMQNGYAGYSGIMTNFHPQLYSWLCNNWEKEPEKAGELQSYLSIASLIEDFGYPMNAKYALKTLGIPIGLTCRRSDMRYHQFSEYDRFLVDQFMVLSKSRIAEL